MTECYVDPGSKGVFSPTASQGLAFRTRKRHVKYRTDKTRQAMDDLAEAMANGAPSISAAARMLVLTQSRADQLWQMIRNELGPQAV